MANTKRCRETPLSKKKVNWRSNRTCHFLYSGMILRGTGIVKNMTKSTIKWVKSISKSKFFLFLMVIALAVLGSLYIYNTWTTAMNETSKQATNTARTAEASFLKEVLNKLDVSPKDIENPIYASIKSILEKLVKVNKGIRFAYIYTQKEGNLYFLSLIHISEPTRRTPISY